MTDTFPPTEAARIRSRVRELLPALRGDLERLSRIPSVSLQTLDDYDATRVEASAEAVADLLRAEGLTVEIVREGGQPAVIGHADGPPGAPTVMLYAHHDVQPCGDPAGWDSPPWEPTERGGRLYGRGVADDKAGVTAHLAALRVHAGALPVGVTVFVEGEEEVGSESLPKILQRHGEKLRADAIVLADSGNWEVGQPALTTTLRGLVRAVVTVRTLDHGLHSGMFGGPVPDALTVLVRLLGTLHDAEGNVAVPGLRSGTASELPYDEARLRAESGVLDGVQLTGSGSLLSRLWAKPSLTVIGIDERDDRNVLIKPTLSVSIPFIFYQGAHRRFTEPLFNHNQFGIFCQRLDQKAALLDQTVTDHMAKPLVCRFVRCAPIGLAESGPWPRARTECEIMR